LFQTSVLAAKAEYWANPDWLLDRNAAGFAVVLFE